MWKEKTGLQLYSVRDELQKDFEGTLRKVKEMGYGAVEFAGLYDNEPEKVKALCEEIGLVPLSAHVPFQELTADPEGTVERYRRAGCRYIVIPYLTEEYRPGAEKFDDVLKYARLLGEICARNGMALQYHNHDFEFAKIDGEYALDVLYREVGPELLQTQIDTCWVNVAGEESKFGATVEETEELVQSVSGLPGIRICGLMTIAPFVENAEDNRLYFRKLRQMSVDIERKNIDNVSMNVLSMGMTGDYTVAVEEGAAYVRVGTGIFGERDYVKGMVNK